MRASIAVFVIIEKFLSFAVSAVSLAKTSEKRANNHFARAALCCAKVFFCCQFLSLLHSFRVSVFVVSKYCIIERQIVYFPILLYMLYMRMSAVRFRFFSLLVYLLFCHKIALHRSNINIF